jgi:hypothetical protein
VRSPAALLAAVLLACMAGCAARVDIVPRSDWGWEPADASMPQHSISRITIHHGGTIYNDDRDSAEYLRSLQKWSRADKGWIDLPYHYVIDLQGRIFEGRPIQFPGDTNTSYDPTGHALIVVVGNYDNRDFSDTQFEALAKLTAHLAQEHAVPLNNIKGHKDYAPGETTCPGTNIYRHLDDGSLVRRVRKLAGSRP